MLCPSKSFRKTISNGGCLYEDNQMVVNQNSNFSLCETRKVVMQSLDKQLSCINFNFDADATADSISSYLIVYASISNGTTSNNSRHCKKNNLSKSKFYH